MVVIVVVMVAFFDVENSRIGESNREGGGWEAEGQYGTNGRELDVKADLGRDSLRLA